MKLLVNLYLGGTMNSKRKMFLQPLPIALIGMIVISLASCQSDQSKPVTKTKEVVKPALIQVNDTKEQLLFLYKDDQGEEQRSMTIDEIPEQARKQVQVIDLSLSPEERRSRSFVQLFDLRQANSAGHYPGRVITRASLEKALAAEQEVPEQPPIILYSTSWCGVCKKAKSFMEKKGLAFVEKDIEKDRAAAKELQEKCARAKIPLGGVPVIDVGGALLRGFDEQRLLSMLNTAHNKK